MGMLKSAIVVMAALYLLALFGLAGSDDYKQEKEQDATYCHMVELWSNNSHLPEEKRPGWPPYKGGCE